MVKDREVAVNERQTYEYSEHVYSNFKFSKFLFFEV